MFSFYSHLPFNLIVLLSIIFLFVVVVEFLLLDRNFLFHWFFSQNYLHERYWMLWSKLKRKLFHIFLLDIKKNNASSAIRYNTVSRSAKILSTLPWIQCFLNICAIILIVFSSSSFSYTTCLFMCEQQHKNVYHIFSFVFKFFMFACVFVSVCVSRLFTVFYCFRKKKIVLVFGKSSFNDEVCTITTAKKREKKERIHCSVVINFCSKGSSQCVQKQK